jgi:hypothetical protein
MSAGAVLVMSFVLMVVFGGVVAALALAYLQERRLAGGDDLPGDE